MAYEMVQNTNRVIAAVSVVMNEAELIIGALEDGKIHYNSDLSKRLDLLSDRLLEAKRLANP